MAVNGAIVGVPCGQSQQNCVDKFGCPSGVSPDFTIRRHDTRPAFKVEVEDCDGPLDLTGLVLEANMWANAKLKAAISETDTYFGLADGIGFEQMMVGDIIVFDQVRLPERMLVKGFDERNKLVLVERGYDCTTAQPWPKGSPFRIMRLMNAPAETEMVYDDVEQDDGTTEEQLIASYFVYEWQANDTCLPGCYWLEFKLLKMLDPSAVNMNFVGILQTEITPSFTDPSLTPEDFDCTLGEGVEWVRRFPSCEEGFLIQIIDSPTAEHQCSL